MFKGGFFAFEIFCDTGKLHVCLSVKAKKAKDFNMGSEALVSLILPVNLIETEKIIPANNK